MSLRFNKLHLTAVGVFPYSFASLQHQINWIYLTCCSTYASTATMFFLQFVPILPRVTQTLLRTKITCSPWAPSPGSPLLWLLGPCSERQSSHFCEYRRTSRCSELQSKEKQTLRPKSDIVCWDQRSWTEDGPLEKTGVCPVSCSSTLAARVSLSPLSPTQMFRQSLRMRSSLMGFSFFSPWSWRAETLQSTKQQHTWRQVNTHTCQTCWSLLSAGVSDTQMPARGHVSTHLRG